MRVFVAGATGAIGRQLVPRLVAAGHEVHGMTRSESKQAMLDELGAVPVVADALDPDQVAEAVGRAKPGRDRPPADRDRGAGHASFRPRLRADEPAADRGDRPPALCRGRRSGCDGSWRRASSLWHVSSARAGR